MSVVETDNPAGTTASKVPVADTSPLLNLAVIGCLRLLRDRFGEVVVPLAVQEELRLGEGRPGSGALEEAFGDGWLRVRPVERERRLARLLQENLDRGESEALALAVEMGERRVLIDEREGRRKARALGLGMTGVLGILLWAAESGRLKSLPDAIARLRSEAGFYVSASLEEKILRQRS